MLLKAGLTPPAGPYRPSLCVYFATRCVAGMTRRVAESIGVTAMPHPAAVLITAIVGLICIGAMWLMCERCWLRKSERAPTPPGLGEGAGPTVRGDSHGSHRPAQAPPVGRSDELQGGW